MGTLAVQNLRRWHWLVIGLLAGLSLGSAQVHWGGRDAEAVRRPSLSPASFEEALLAPPVGGHPVLTDLTVVPAGGDGRGDYVTMRMLVPSGRPGERVYREREFRTPAGHTPAVDYLKGLAARYPRQARWRYAWWKAPAATVGLWALGCAVLVGGVWPSVVSLLVGAGYGRPEPDYDLGRFGAEAPPPAAAAPGPSAEDEARVRQLTDELLGRLAAPGGAPPPPGVSPPAPAPQLAAAGGDDHPAPGPPDAEEKHYQGEFYPVARPAGGHPPHAE